MQCTVCFVARRYHNSNRWIGGSRSKPLFLCATDLTLSLGCTDAWNILVGATSVSGFDLSRIIVQQAPHSTSHLIPDTVMKSHHEPDWENTPGDGSHTYLALGVNLLLGVDWPRGSYSARDHSDFSHKMTKSCGLATTIIPCEASQSEPTTIMDNTWETRYSW